MYKIDGSVHHEGVKNEERTVSILNELKIYSSTVESRGGTKRKEDAIADSLKISIKRKEGIENGSFDWFNTSKYNDLLNSIFDEFLSSMKEMRSIPKTILEDKEFILKVRDNFDILCESCLNQLSSENLTEIIRTGLIEELSEFDVVVNDVITKTLYIFNAESHPAFDYINQGYSIVLQGSGKTSRKVLFFDGINYYDCGLRIRITSNNGIKAFLGLSKANRNSQVVIKLQQDNIKQLLTFTNTKQYDY